MFGVLSGPAAYRFLPEDPPVDVPSLRRCYERQSQGAPKDSGEIWLNWIVRQMPGGSAIGYVQATVIGRVALLGYHLAPEHWGRGLGRASLRLLVDAIFTRSDVDEAHALVDTRNAASIAILEALGFGRVETISGADHFKGVTSDEYRFVLKRDRAR